MADRTENTNINLYIRNAQAVAAQEALRKNYLAIQREQKKLTAGSADWLRLQKDLDGVTKKQVELLRNMDLTTASVKQLRAAATQLKGIRDSIAPGTKEFKALDDQINKVNARLSQLNGKGGADGGGLLGNIKLGWLAVAGVVATAANAIKNFAAESIMASAKAEGVKNAFDRLNDPGLLDNLRKATRGTITDLQLMQVSVKAKNFQIPLEQMGTLLEFARRRAKDTGEEIDYLVDSMVTGLGRKSAQILDNLGISTSRLKDEMGGVALATASVGEVTAAVGRIAQEELRAMGDEAVTQGDRIAQVSVMIDNLKVKTGDVVNKGIIGIAYLFGFLDEEIANAEQSMIELGRQTEAAEWVSAFTEGANNAERLSNTIDEIWRTQDSMDKAEARQLAIKQEISDIETKTLVWNDALKERYSLLKKENEELASGLIFRTEYLKQLEAQETSLNAIANTKAPNTLGAINELLQAANDELLNMEIGTAAYIAKQKEITDLENRRTIALGGETAAMKAKREEQEKFMKLMQDQNKEQLHEETAVSPINPDKDEETRLAEKAKWESYFDEMSAVMFNMNEQILLRNDSGRVAELEASQKKWDDLILQAEQYGLDASALYEVQREERAAINAKWNDQELADQQAMNEKKRKDEEALYDAILTMADNYAGALGDLMGLVAGKNSAFAEFQKGLAFIQISINAAKALSENIALATAAAAAGGPAAPFLIAGYIASGVATIFGAVKQAKELLMPEVPAAPQFESGTKSLDGQIMKGPSHARGGIKLVDSQTGKVIGEGEGNEAIVPADTVAANPGIFNALFANRGKPIRPAALSTAPPTLNLPATRSNMKFESGGFIPSPVNMPTTNTTVNVNNAELVAELRDMKAEMRGMRNDYKTIKPKIDFSLKELEDAQADKQEVIDFNEVRKQ